MKSSGEGRVGELVGLCAPKLSVEVSLLEVEDLGLLLNAREELQQLSDQRSVDVGQGVPVGLVEVGQHLPVPVEYSDLVLPDHDVVVQPDVPRDLPHDVSGLELVVPGYRGGAEDASARGRNARFLSEHSSLTSSGGCPPSPRSSSPTFL